MKRPYLLLFFGSMLAGLLIVGVGRAPRREPPRVPTRPEVHVDSVSLEIGEGFVNPERVSVSKGNRVRLRVENRSGTAIQFALAGYEDRVQPEVIPPGAIRHDDFRADRPGEDFAWLIDGRPVGRFIVTGSHLVEGHR